MEIRLIELMRVNTKKVRYSICSSANYNGKNCWIWEPKWYCVNKQICLVAHIDTVHEEPKDKKVFYDQENKVYWSPNGLGADDRAGVYAVMAIRQKTGCMVLLTDKEESGGAGATEASTKFGDKFKNIKLFVELDRQGKNECVFYNGESKKFRNYVKKFGFKESRGSFSDISIICNNLNTVGTNLSIGYYNAHRKEEYLVELIMYDTITKVTNMVTIIRDYSKISEGWEISKAYKYHDIDVHEFLKFRKMQTIDDVPYWIREKKFLDAEQTMSEEEEDELLSHWMY